MTTDARRALAQAAALGFVCLPKPDGGVQGVYILPGVPEPEDQERATRILRPHKGAIRELLLDPRPDLDGDHALWRAVLSEAARLDPDPRGYRSLYGLLHGLRCAGARLRWRGDRLFLDIHPVVEGNGWGEDYLRREWLLPSADGIKTALDAAAERLRQTRQEVTA